MTANRPARGRLALTLQMLVFALLAIVSVDASFTSAGAASQVVSPNHGAIVGRAFDQTGEPLRDVTVQLSSGSLMQPQVTVTADDGSYRFVALKPGAYELTFELSGFRRTLIDVQIGAGLATTADAILQIGGVAESITVTRSGVDDVHSTARIERFTSAELGALPTSRSMFAILSATPGVQVARFEVGGNTGDAGGPYSAYGTRGLNRPIVEGINVAQLFPLGFPLDYGAFEEVSVGLAAHGPEWPLPGVTVQFVAKSGGGQYHGNLFGTFGHHAWQSHNIDADQQRRGRAAAAGSLSREANRMWRSYDANVDVGGFIVRNRVWWYGSLRDQDLQTRLVNFAAQPSRTRLGNYTGKVTIRTGERHNFIGFAQGGRNYQPNRLDPFGPSAAGGQVLNASTAIHESVESTATQRASGIVWKTEWNGTLGQRFFAEVRIGQFDAFRPLFPNGTAPRFEDVDTLRVWGGGRQRDEHLRRNQFHGSLSYFTGRWVGSHHVKAGGEILDTVSAEGRAASYPGDVLHVLRSGTPAEVYLFLTPSRSLNGLFAAAAHVGDTWRVSERLTLQPGIRFDRFRVFLPAQEHPRGGAGGQPIAFAAVDSVVGWSLLAPRIGSVFDVSGNRTTIVKGSYARYWLGPGDLGPNVNPNAPEWWRRYTWLDANRSGMWEPGEEGPRADSIRGGVAAESIDPALGAPWVDEATASAERAFSSALTVSTGLVWRRESRRYTRQNAARPFDAFGDVVQVADPGPDGVAANSDDGPDILAYNLRLDPSRPVAPTNIVRNVSGPGSRHLTWEISAGRRRSGRWSMSAGFAHTWSLEHANAYSGQTVRQNAFVLTPNDLINTADSGRHRLRTWTLNASATFHAPGGFVLTPLLRHQSGQPFGRTISTQMNYGLIRVLAEPIGTRRTDNVTLVDLRLEHQIRGGVRRYISIFMDAFNLFNANPEENVSWASGAGFLQPLTVVSPRVLHVGVKAGF